MKSHLLFLLGLSILLSAGGCEQSEKQGMIKVCNLVESTGAMKRSKDYSVRFKIAFLRFEKSVRNKEVRKFARALDANDIPGKIKLIDSYASSLGIKRCSLKEHYKAWYKEEQKAKAKKK